MNIPSIKPLSQAFLDDLKKTKSVLRNPELPSLGYKKLPRKPRMLASGMNWQNN